MTAPLLAAASIERRARQRRYLMCPPTYFDVVYAINPWMDPSVAVDRALAMRQWERLRDTYRNLGHTVEVIAPVEGLPDMVFSANGGFLTDGAAVVARFASEQRTAEADAFAAWYAADGATTVRSEHPFEGEGDLLRCGDLILAGYGFRTTREAHAQVARVTGREVVSLELVDPRYYHLDVALCPLDEDLVAYLPQAFSADARREIQLRYPDAIEVGEEEAAWLALNGVSDGRRVVLPVQAERFARSLADHGFTPVPVDVSEFLKSGGGVKCMTAELG